MIDWSGNCGNLTAAVGPFAIGAGLLDAPADGTAAVRIWQANIGKKIIAHVPMRGGEVLESGSFQLDGVAFPSAEVKLEFIDPAGGDDQSGAGATFPTGREIDLLEVPGLGTLEATLINAGNPTIFVDAGSLRLERHGAPAGCQRQEGAARAGRSGALTGRRGHGSRGDYRGSHAKRPSTPKIAFVAKPAAYTASDGKRIDPASIDLLARIFSMGKLHHAMTGTGAVALAAAAAIPGTIVHRIAPLSADGAVRFGHPSGTLSLGAEAICREGEWIIRKAIVSRSARRLMEGWVRVPLD